MSIKETAFKHILDFYPGHVYWQGIDGVTLGCNKKQAEALGLSVDEVTGKTLSEIYSKEEAEKLFSIIQKIVQTGEPVLLQEELVLQGTKHYFISEKRPIKDKAEKVIGIIGLSVNVTKQKLAEEALGKEKIKSALAECVKEEFLENMAHDWRTPFTGIYSLSCVLSQDETDPKKKELLEAIHTCSVEILKWFEDLSAMVSLGKKPCIQKSFSFQAILESLSKIMGPACKSKNIDLKIECREGFPNFFLGDEYRIQAILVHLISNAVKFTKKGGVHVSLKGHAIHTDDGFRKKYIVEISVKDTGIGISTKDQDLIFQPFIKLSPSWKGVYEGLGTGLTKVRKFLEDIGGEIELQSLEGKGSTFTVLLPLKISLLEEIK